MTDNKPDPRDDAERTATDDMDDRYRNGARIVPITRDPEQSEPTGLPPGVHDSDESPISPFLP